MLPLLKSARLARMSDGHYCFVRDLGPVKGGKGMKHHEVVLDLTFRGVLQFLKRLLAGQAEWGLRMIAGKISRGASFAEEETRVPDIANPPA
jgi:hypothetical protein